MNICKIHKVIRDIKNHQRKTTNFSTRYPSNKQVSRPIRRMVIHGMLPYKRIETVLCIARFQINAPTFRLEREELFIANPKTGQDKPRTDYCHIIIKCFKIKIMRYIFHLSGISPKEYRLGTKFKNTSYFFLKIRKAFNVLRQLLIKIVKIRPLLYCRLYFTKSYVTSTLTVSTRV